MKKKKMKKNATTYYYKREDFSSFFFSIEWIYSISFCYAYWFPIEAFKLLVAELRTGIAHFIGFGFSVMIS